MKSYCNSATKVDPQVISKTQQKQFLVCKFQASCLRRELFINKKNNSICEVFKFVFNGPQENSCVLIGLEDNVFSCIMDESNFKTGTNEFPNFLHILCLEDIFKIQKSKNVSNIYKIEAEEEFPEYYRDNFVDERRVIKVRSTFSHEIDKIETPFINGVLFQFFTDIMLTKHNNNDSLNNCNTILKLILTSIVVNNLQRTLELEYDSKQLTLLQNFKFGSSNYVKPNVPLKSHNENNMNVILQVHFVLIDILEELHNITYYNEVMNKKIKNEHVDDKRRQFYLDFDKNIVRTKEFRNYKDKIPTKITLIDNCVNKGQKYENNQLLVDEIQCNLISNLSNERVRQNVFDDESNCYHLKFSFTNYSSKYCHIESDCHIVKCFVQNSHFMQEPTNEINQEAIKKIKTISKDSPNKIHKNPEKNKILVPQKQQNIEFGNQMHELSLDTCSHDLSERNEKLFNSDQSINVIHHELPTIEHIQIVALKNEYEFNILLKNYTYKCRQSATNFTSSIPCSLKPPCTSNKMFFQKDIFQNHVVNLRHNDSSTSYQLPNGAKALKSNITPYVKSIQRTTNNNNKNDEKILNQPEESSSQSHSATPKYDGNFQNKGHYAATDPMDSWEISTLPNPQHRCKAHLCSKIKLSEKENKTLYPCNPYPYQRNEPYKSKLNDKSKQSKPNVYPFYKKCNYGKQNMNTFSTKKKTSLSVGTYQKKRSMTKSTLPNLHNYSRRCQFIVEDEFFFQSQKSQFKHKARDNISDENFIPFVFDDAKFIMQNDSESIDFCNIYEEVVKKIEPFAKSTRKSFVPPTFLPKINKNHKFSKGQNYCFDEDTQTSPSVEDSLINDDQWNSLQEKTCNDYMQDNPHLKNENKITMTSLKGKDECHHINKKCNLEKIYGKSYFCNSINRHTKTCYKYVSESDPLDVIKTRKFINRDDPKVCTKYGKQCREQCIALQKARLEVLNCTNERHLYSNTVQKTWEHDFNQL